MYKLFGDKTWMKLLNLPQLRKSQDDIQENALCLCTNAA